MQYGFATIYWRDMIRFVRFKTLLVSSLLQPALWLAFFGIAMSSSFDKLVAGVPGIPGVHTIGYLTFMGAGIIAMTTLFTSLFGGIVILFDKNWGLMREILASPMNRNHIIFGIGLSGVTKSFIQAIIIMVFGILIGAAFFSGFSAMQTVIGVHARPEHTDASPPEPQRSSAQCSKPASRLHCPRGHPLPAAKT